MSASCSWCSRLGAVADGAWLPRFELSGESITMIVAIFGTTISPYLFFWQSSQEVEEDRGRSPRPRRC